jgi:quinoprotein glucose dehydrogenase
MAFPPGPIAGTGPAAVRTGAVARGAAAPYPEGVPAPADRFAINGYGTIATAVKPPFTTLTAYNLNSGTIKWQIPLGDDLRLLANGVTGTGTAHQMKTGMIVSASGLVFVSSGDNKVRALDAANGKELWSATLGAPTQGGPAMYELNGRQYLVVTASDVGLRYGRLPGSAPTSGPTGVIVYALPSR